jgi:hypothetical protein
MRTELLKSDFLFGEIGLGCEGFCHDSFGALKE